MSATSSLMERTRAFEQIAEILVTLDPASAGRVIAAVVVFVELPIYVAPKDPKP